MVYIGRAPIQAFPFTFPTVLSFTISLLSLILMVKIFRYSEAHTKGRAGYTAAYVADIVLREEIKSAGFIVVNVPKETKTQPHAHMELEEVFVIMNRTKIGVNDSIYELERGDIILVEPGEAHHIETFDSPVTIIAVKLPNLKKDKVQPD